MQPVIGAENFTTETVAYEATSAITAGRKGTTQGIARAKQGQKDERATTQDPMPGFTVFAKEK